MADAILERIVVGVAHALFINRLHVLRLTEVVRLGIKPDAYDGDMQLPAELDEQMREQAFDYVVAYMPKEFVLALTEVRASWLRPA